VHIGFIAIESPFDSDAGGGISAYLRAMIPSLTHAGHRVTVIVNERRSGSHESVDESVRVVPVHLPNLHWYAGKLPLLDRTVVLPLRQFEWSAAFYRAARAAFPLSCGGLVACGR
jgi:Glycosyl transferase 4-like domain